MRATIVRVVHTTPTISSDDRMHTMNTECWCGPIEMDSFSTRYIMHHDPEPRVGPKWWLAIPSTLLPDEYRAARVAAGMTHKVLEQCALGRHFDCGDWGGGLGCECRCHEIAERAIMKAHEEGELP